jgi:hypothetical protein
VELQVPTCVHSDVAESKQGTDEENRAVVRGSLAFYGTYEVDEASKSLMMRIEYSSFPNFNGAEQRRSIKLEGDELTVINPAKGVE